MTQFMNKSFSVLQSTPRRITPYRTEAFDAETGILTIETNVEPPQMPGMSCGCLRTRFEEPELFWVLTMCRRHSAEHKS
jgi:hypothetical protein